ncbi:MAG: GTPase ObgE [Caldilineae bacterium]|nr:GTPase ObgE [Chloroflexota bacterium]MCB9176949.1 GTPase ObgE [Caldilineae bacterium]
MFLDEAEIDVEAGNGGNGVVAFRREKYVPRGGPNGGHGGKGGDVILVGDEGLNTLHAFRFTQRYQGGRGGHGGSQDKHGRNGEDLRVAVPVGTVVREAETGELVGDVTRHGQELVVAKGGRGGRGNSAFKSATNQAPRVAEKGSPGQVRRLKLELKLIADVGVIGLPNAGKSTLLSVVSAARPKIADYPFTTLVPNLGVVEIGHATMVLADVPGLIEGASEGLGLGDRFLRHIERTRILLHLVDGSQPDPLADFRIINQELAAYSPELAERPQIVAVNKIDLPETRERWPALRAALLEAGAAEVLAISAATTENVEALMQQVFRRLGELPPPEPAVAELPVLRPLEQDENAFTIEPEDAGVWRLSGPRIERSAFITDWDNPHTVARFQRILDAMGIREALRQAGVVDGDTVCIGDFELEWVD